MDWLRLSWVPGTDMEDMDHTPCSALTMNVLKAQALLLSWSVIFGLKTALFLFATSTLVASYHQHTSPTTHVYGYCELQVMVRIDANSIISQPMQLVYKCCYDDIHL
jgi:hypothetical protein